VGLLGDDAVAEQPHGGFAGHAGCVGDVPVG